ncbi:transposase [Actimicrobium sp. CCI2.3]|uniref:transposase n=1 Tax=Actimicrobium sp. CCI2.3 TaxID=3048616 RepID=UPI003A1029C0
MAVRQSECVIVAGLTSISLTLSTSDYTAVSRRAGALPIMKLTSTAKGSLTVLVVSAGLDVFGAYQ